MKKGICYLAVTMMTAAMLSGCGSGAGNQNEAAADAAKTETMAASAETQKPEKSDKEQIVITGITFEHEEGGLVWLDYVKEKFEAEHPGVTIEMESLSDDDYYALLRSKVSSGDVPDIFQIQSYEKNAEMINAGLCYDLSKTDWLSENIQENAIEALTTEDGAVYALPVSLNIMCVTYNKDVFEQAGITEIPKTYSEFIAACQKIKDIGLPAILGGYQDKWTMYAEEQNDQIRTTILNDRNNRIDLAAGTTTWKEDKAKYSEVLKRWAQRLPYYNDDLFGTDWTTAENLLATAKGGMILNGSWVYSGVKGINPDCNIGIFPLPLTENPEDAKLLAASSLGGYCVNPNSEHVAEALEYLKAMSEPESGEAYMEYKMNITTSKNTTVSEDSYVKDFMEYVDAGVVFDWSGYNEVFADDELQNIWCTCISEFIMDENHDVDACLERLDQQFQSALNK